VFTGLVAGTGTVESLKRDGAGVRLRVRTDLAGELGPGDSVAVNGVCLTAVESDGSGFSADVMEETLRRSSLGPLESGDAVNLELPLRAGDRLGGHIVQGHVDGRGEVDSVRDEGLSRVVRIKAPADLLRYVVEKGSIAVEGVSLTVSDVDDVAFEVSLIPETLERTTLGAAAPGRTLNLEVDVLAKYVEKAIRSHSAEPSAHGKALRA
jgi:riboflavin synthase